MTKKEKLEQALNTPDTVYQFEERWVEHHPPVYGATHPTIPTKKKRLVLGRLMDFRDGVLNIDTGSNIETLQFEDLKDIRLPDGKPMTQNKIGFDM